MIENGQENPWAEGGPGEGSDTEAGWRVRAINSSPCRGRVVQRHSGERVLPV